MTTQPYETPIHNFAVISLQQGTNAVTLANLGQYYSFGPFQISENANNVTTDITNGKLTIVQGGWYSFSFNATLSVSTQATVVISLFINDQLHANSHFTVTVPAFQVVNFSVSDINLLNPGDVLQMKVQRTSAFSSADVTLIDANFMVVSI